MDEVKITINIGPDAVRGYFKRLSRRGMILKMVLLVFFVSSVIGFSLSRSVERSYVWDDGDIIVADEVNTNFNKLFDAVNLLVGNTENAGIEWFEEKFKTICGEINDKIMENEDLLANLPSSGTDLPTNLIVYWNKPYAEIPTYWNWYNDGTNNIADKFIAAPGDEHDLGNSSDINSHVHIIDHIHESISVKTAGAHNHGIFNLYKYLPETPFGSRVVPWSWEIYDVDGIPGKLEKTPSDNYDNEDAYCYEEDVNNGENYPMGVDLDDDDVFLSQSDFFRFYTKHNLGHSHNVVDNSTVDNSGTVNFSPKDDKESQQKDNIPPYHALHLIQKD